MSKLQQQVQRIFNNLDREHRAIVSESLTQCDGTLASFELELVAASWEHPGFNAQEVLEQLA